MAQDFTGPPAGSRWEQRFLEAVDRETSADRVDVRAPRELDAAAAWATSVPAGYAETVSPRAAAGDFIALAQLGTDTALRTHLLPGDLGDRDVEGDRDETGTALRGAGNGDGTPGGDTWRFVLHHRAPQVLPLSSFLPVLESFGFTVIAANAFRLPEPHAEPLTETGTGTAAAQPVGTPDVQVQVFTVTHPALDVATAPRPDVAGALAEAVEAVWRGDADVDRLNRLVLTAGLSWPQVAVLRAYRRYRRQVGTTFTADYIDRALIAEPQIAQALVEYFTVRLQPSGPARDADVARAREHARKLIEEVEDLDADRILRDLLALVDATVRTNYWLPDAPRALALKMRPSDVPGMPNPVPYREIFVSAPRMEGTHLRGGPVARGGIRWSSRLEDYRTEILSLLKAQMVKNSVIVPTGAKGGFVLRDGGADPATVEQGYRLFITALLEVTDTVRPDGSAQHPTGVRALDGPDPYLVVAADKGTATFSDTANAIAAERGFWLGDAFASGGRTGYDHKELAVTARGAWEAARHHFAALGLDPERDPVTVVGIGDMSGDVFGNGMLRSRSLRLLAAFDYRHVFLDPSPDPQTAYAERERLFGLARSSWADYDRSLISPGGGVWSRWDKRIPLSPAVRHALGLPDDVDELPGPELVSAVLSAPVDLLYAGGVGTYVKATRESHADAGDRGNDAIRVDAAGLRARVVVEGANLAMTQAARVEYAAAGGAINTDAVDNSAGVDTSDHEVNLKVLLALPVSDGVLTPADRDRLLESQRDWVVRGVLGHVRAQMAALSREARTSADRLLDYADLLGALEEPSAWPRIDRAADALPAPAELERLARHHRGLTRPQLAVLMGVVKSNLRRELIDAALQDREPFHQVLCGYFPDQVHRRYGRWLHDRRLSRELAAAVVAARLANEVVERMGLTWVHDVAAELGVDRVRVVQAYWAARLVLDAPRAWNAVDARSGPGDLEVLDGAHEGIRRSVAETARRYAARATFDPAATVAADAGVFAALVADVEDRGPWQHVWRVRAQWLVERRVAHQDAAHITAVEFLGATADIAEVARATGRPPALTAVVFAELDAALRLPELEEALRRHRRTARDWERREVAGLRGDWRELRADCATAVLQDSGPSAGEAVRRWLARHQVSRPVMVPTLVSADLDELPVTGLSVLQRTLRRCFSQPLAGPSALG